MLYYDDTVFLGNAQRGRNRVYIELYAYKKWVTFSLILALFGSSFMVSQDYTYWGGILLVLSFASIIFISVINNDGSWTIEDCDYATFRDDNTSKIISVSKYPWVYVLIFGSFYFLYKRVWSHFFLFSALNIIPLLFFAFGWNIMLGLAVTYSAFVIYAIFTRKIVVSYFESRGWDRV